MCKYPTRCLYCSNDERLGTSSRHKTNPLLLRTRSSSSGVGSAQVRLLPLSLSCSPVLMPQILFCKGRPLGSPLPSEPMKMVLNWPSSSQGARKELGPDSLAVGSAQFSHLSTTTVTAQKEHAKETAHRAEHLWHCRCT